MFFLHEQQRAVSFHSGTSAAQVTPTSVQLTFSDSDKAPLRLTTNVSVERVALSEGSLAIYGSGKVLTYEVQEELRHALFGSEFQLFCDAVAVHEQSVITMESNRINIRSFQVRTMNFV